MQVTHTHRSSLTDNADGERSETIIPSIYLQNHLLNILSKGGLAQ